MKTGPARLFALRDGAMFAVELTLLMSERAREDGSTEQTIGRGFFSDYPGTMAALPTEACNACHEANGSQDWVFTQLYPVLRAAKPNS